MEPHRGETVEKKKLQVMCTHNNTSEDRSQWISVNDTLRPAESARPLLLGDTVRRQTTETAGNARATNNCTTLGEKFSSRRAQ